MTFPELYILRHGETLWNAEDRMQGWLNSPLTPKGLEHARRQGAILAERDLEGFAFWCSPAGRAIQTAGLACPMAEAIHTDVRLREIGVGDWAGRLRHELPPGEGPDPYLAQYDMAPGGEGTAAVRARVEAFLAELQGPAVIVTHGITSRMLRATVIGDQVLDSPSPNGGQGGVYHLKDGVQELLT
ncbi:histidine phosphatase family protein [Thalassorhabdomicrobium marinisediminis]|uniref:Histidine phosphatase family protein n=1 Tax=Thalassorhabdomicrobium marinisediminis TaxID=2170577 RepID=A0A2T7FVA6_9RHOB|nr:histidine phosphatase family protein [Thalassorhabdomicrobium marinisediminis]PVA06103.1 histidine phosphatase family protein [Thalassorhabdomicrobium marinisediminis]